jgi:hypothetical protein
MKTFRNIVLCALATIIVSPVAAFLINFVIDFFIWIEFWVEHFMRPITTSIVGHNSQSDIGWTIISASIAKFAIPFVGASNIVDFGGRSKYTWPPAVSFFLFSMYCAVHNVYFYMNMVSSN